MNVLRSCYYYYLPAPASACTVALPYNFYNYKRHRIIFQLAPHQAKRQLSRALLLTAAALTVAHHARSFTAPAVAGPT